MKVQAKEGAKRREKVGKRVEIKVERERVVWNLGLVCGLLSDDCNDGDDVCIYLSLFFCLSFFCLMTLTHSSNQSIRLPNSYM